MFRRAVLSLPGSERIGRAPQGAKIVIHATAEETTDAFAMWETLKPPGAGPAPHTHTRETEVFRVVRDVSRFQCGDETFDAPPGSVVTLPPHVRHGWRNISDEPGQRFAIVTPGGLERMSSEIAASGAHGPREIAASETRFGIANDETEASGA